MHVTSYPCEPPRELIEASAVAHQKYPTDISFLKIYINYSAVGTRIVHLRRFLETDVEGLISIFHQHSFLNNYYIFGLTSRYVSYSSCQHVKSAKGWRRSLFL